MDWAIRKEIMYSISENLILYPYKWQIYRHDIITQGQFMNKNKVKDYYIWN